MVPLALPVFGILQVAAVVAVEAGVTTVQPAALDVRPLVLLVGFMVAAVR